MKYVDSGLADVSTTHMHRMPKRLAATESPKLTKGSPLFAPCRDEPACAGSTDECKSEATDLANSPLVDGTIQ